MLQASFDEFEEDLRVICSRRHGKLDRGQSELEARVKGAQLDHIVEAVQVLRCCPDVEAAVPFCMSTRVGEVTIVFN